MTQKYLEQQNPASLVEIVENSGVESHRVIAPLPETFGFTVGSEFSSPFDTGISSGLVQKALAIGSISQKIGLRMKKMYANPEPVEISFDLEFTAFYSAADEVVAPVIRLAAMSLGRSIQDLDERAHEVIRKVAGKAGSVGDAVLVKSEGHMEQDSTSGNIIKRVADLIGIIEGPNTQWIRFGNIYEIPDVYITSISPQFSNVLDKRGYPMSAVCSVTVTLEQYPIADDVLDWFGQGSGVSVNRGGAGFTPRSEGNRSLGDYL